MLLISNNNKPYISISQNYVVLGGTAHPSDNKDVRLDHKQWILESTRKLMPSLAVCIELILPNIKLHNYYN